MAEVGTSSGSSVEEIEARYQAERAKRLRPDGLAQYADIRLLDGDLDRDPYVDTPLVRDALDEEVDVVIVGSGLGGLQAAVRLAQQGVTNVRIIDKAGDFGGTWYWNRYPGAACDVESYIYMPLLEETGYIPTEKYAKAPEIFAHCQRIAEQFDLYPHALFQTNVTEAALARRRQPLAGHHRSGRPDPRPVHRRRRRASCTGRSFPASRGSRPSAAPRSTPAGGTTTTPAAARPSRLDKLADKRVALIGTGATSVQVFPRLAQSAEHVTSASGPRRPSGCATTGRPTRSGPARSARGGIRNASRTSPASSRARRSTPTWWPTGGPRSSAATPTPWA